MLLHIWSVITRVSQKKGILQDAPSMKANIIQFDANFYLGLVDSICYALNLYEHVFIMKI